MILYATLAKGPKLSPTDQMNSTRQFMRELNRFGITSVIDAGGGFQNYPDDYGVIDELHRRGELTVRFAYNLFTQKPKQELADFQRWTQMTRPGEGDDFYRMNGAGEMLVFSAADFEDFLEPRPEMPPVMEDELKEVIRHLVENRWPFRLHATYDETISRALKVYEEVNREVPFDGLHWFFDHCETISDRNIERIKALGGGIAVQDRMAFQGEYFVDRYGAKQAQRTPPIRRMLELGVPVGAGTDATRVSSYNPFVALYWLITGKTVGGTALYPEGNRLDRMEALRLYTVGSSWFSSEEGKKGSLAPGQLADLSVLSADYFSIPEEQIKHLESVLTIVGGRIVFAAGEFERLGPPPLPVSPDWSPVKTYGGYAPPGYGADAAAAMRPRSRPRGESAQVGAWRVRAVVLGLRLFRLLALNLTGNRRRPFRRRGVPIRRQRDANRHPLGRAGGLQRFWREPAKNGRDSPPVLGPVETRKIHGDDDQIVPISASALLSSKIIKSATLKVYPGAPHGLGSTLKDRGNDDLLAFFKAQMIKRWSN